MPVWSGREVDLSTPRVLWPSAETRIESIEAGVPELAVVVEPLRRFPEWGGPHRDNRNCAFRSRTMSPVLSNTFRCFETA